MTRRSWVPLAAVASICVVVVVGDLVQVPYLVYRPGPAVDTLGSRPDGKPLISIDGAPTYPTTGALDFTTVTMSGAPGYELSVWDLLAARLDPRAEIRHRDEVFPPGVTRDQISQVSKAQMSGSQQEAVAVALRATGRQVTERAVVRDVVADSPAAGRVRPGDVVVAVGGRPVTTTSAVSRLVQQAPADKPVALRVLRDGRAVALDIPARLTQGRRFLGVSLEPQFQMPVRVTIDAGDVGGPSAGMMFALGVYDKLTKGALTGGNVVAGTGTIDADGTVGRIDSIPHKMAGAAQAGAGWFLAPAANCPDVVGQVPVGVTVVRVATFAQARSAVEAIAAGRGESLPGCG